MRIVTDNLVNRPGVQIVASSTAGALTPENLKTDRKGMVWRSQGLEATLTVSLPVVEFINCVVLGFTNFSATTEMRVRVLSGADVEYDSGWVLACPTNPFGDFAWGSEPLGVNHYSYSEQHAYGYHWLPEVRAGNSVKISLKDPLHPATYLEASRLVIGQYWQPEITADLGVTLGTSDSSRVTRLESGDLATALGPRSKSLSFSLGSLSPREGQRLRALLLAAGQKSSVFASLYPENQDSSKEQAFQLIGKLSKTSSLKLTHFNNSSSSIELEEL